jgi:histidyl-tRNA synthetase
LQPIILLTGTNAEKIAQLHDVLASSETGMKGLDEIETILNYTGALGIKQEIELDLSLARGLNYYTGAIFEVKALDFQIGSITGGGRYDDLTGIFGLNNVSGVGISFGADRIYDVMTNLELFPADILQSTKLLFVNFGQKEELFCLNLLSILRKAGVPCEIFPDSAKMKKQMNYADKKSIPYVAIVGETEINEGYVTIKNMQSGEQRNIATQDILNFAF